MSNPESSLPMHHEIRESQFYPPSYLPKNWTTEAPQVEYGVVREIEEGEPFLFPVGFQVAAHIFYNLVLILGLIGNGCVLLIFIVRRPQFRKLPTPLLANLAVGDLLITLFCLETGYISLIWQYWPFGKFLCYALSPVKPISVFVSCYTLIALSVDRYLTVKDPLRGGVLFQENFRWTVTIIWVLSVATSLPVGIFTSYETHESTGLPRCGEYVWDSEVKEMIYDSALIILQFVTPLLVLIYTYTKISIVVLQNRQLRARMSPGVAQRDNSFRTFLMSLMVVVGYTIAWLPYNVVAILGKYNSDLVESDHFPYIFVACHWLAMSHSVFNPVIYFWLNDSFRIIVLELFFKKAVRNSERRRLSSAHLSWRNTTLTTYNGGSSFTRQSTRLKPASQQVTPTSDYPASYPTSPLFTLPAAECTTEQEGVTLINEVKEEVRKE